MPGPLLFAVSPCFLGPRIVNTKTGGPLWAKSEKIFKTLIYVGVIGHLENGHTTIIMAKQIQSNLALHCGFLFYKSMSFILSQWTNTLLYLRRD